MTDEQINKQSNPYKNQEPYEKEKDSIDWDEVEMTIEILVSLGLMALLLIQLIIFAHNM